MAFNKSKALENALKYLNQGRVAQAISEYQQILRHDANDQATLMTVGDLFARQGDMTQAIEYFARLAQVYLNDGFNSKAIAIYKKIGKLAPNELGPLERLADLYVQQGVLSEARPLFLQIAEAHLKANHAVKAVEVLHRLLEVEPENLRVQMRLAELYHVMGQKKESAQTYLSFAQRLYERGELEEAQKLTERSLEVDSSNAPALLLKAKFLSASGKDEQAIKILEHHPEAETGGEVTDLLVNLELKAGHTERAADRGRRQLARGQAHYVLLNRVVDALIEGGQVDEALPLLRELRDPMIEASEQDKFLKALSNAVERLPGHVEPLEMLVDFCRHTSDPFRLSAALGQLADAYAAAGNFPRAEELLQELVDRNKDDERVVERLNKMRARSAGGAAPPELPAEPRMAEAKEKEEEVPEETHPAALPILEETLDEETQRYISQALTDVDLFSSYGLTQKATHLLENVLERAPRHTPTLERLLDLYLGAGNERRTAELAAQLEQIHRERNDHVNSERFTELRQRFQKAAGLTQEELPPAAPLAPPEPVVQASAVVAPVPVKAAPTRPAPAAPAEFEVPLTEAEPESAQAEAPPAPSEPQPVAVVEEVDLSDEWEAISQDVVEREEAAKEETAAAPAQEPKAQEVQEIAEEAEPVPTFEIVEETEQEPAAPETVTTGNGDFELELAPKPTSAGKAGAATTEEFINELVSEVDDMEAPLAEPKVVAAPQAAPEPVAAASSAPVAAGSVAPSPPSSAPEPTAESLNQLAEVFQEFRTELGELGEEDEDLETHYNLGIAYREMGLLDEAIGEFQKVAKAVLKGKPFRYAMNCSTLLGLSFMDKGEPKIASLWYQRALEVPGLDPETILALRYDLGVALETAGESSSALESFRQVYAMNIDYRDVADRIATLQRS